ncbi:hypothetical protein C882_2004 [Caenispirillum salinarum AK4]|uniref:Lipoprotein n=1 Tax=Caenispirillum salinarum AK4 TaxID=1238182 RepID=K9GM40_9PROT|nr:hypothetical protein [Caenispirillum salinarum]EKV27075.1 hypothetical protein C882_2004 [Caenispirillum salinarum AK4]
MSAPSRRAPAARALIVLVAAGVGLTACNPLPEPFIDMRREAGTLRVVGSSRLERPAICYNTINATAQEVQALADAVCAETGRVAVYETSDVGQCTVLHPHRSFFRCDQPEAPADGSQQRVTGVEPGPLGVRVPGPVVDEPAEGEDPGVPDLPAAPVRPGDPDGGGLLDIFD